MSNNSQSPSQLFRSLGADSSALDAKLQNSAREAEQRWPLFRALSPAKPELPAALSEEEKRAWEPAEPAATHARKPLLTRQGLGNKLAASLEKFATPKKSTASGKRIAPEPRGAVPASPSPGASAVRSDAPAATQVFAATEGVPNAVTPLFAPQGQPRAPLFEKAAQSDTREKSASSLFGGANPRPLAASVLPRKASAPQSAHSKAEKAPVNPLVTPVKRQDPESLTALFQRMEAAPQAIPAKPAPKTTSSIMRRIGKR